MTSDSKSDPSVQKIQFPRSSKSKLGQNGRFTRSHSFTFIETVKLHFSTFTFFNNHNVAHAIVEHAFGRISNSWCVHDETLVFEGFEGPARSALIGIWCDPRSLTAQRISGFEANPNLFRRKSNLLFGQIMDW